MPITIITLLWAYVNNIFNVFLNFYKKKRAMSKLSPLSRHKFQIYHDTSFNGIFQT